MNASPTISQNEPLRKLNPNPKQGYRIILTIADAPGPLVLTDARAQYDVTNESACGKEQPSGGVYRMTSNEPLVLTKVSDTVYEGIVYADKILDEDYYGDGVCHWEFSGIRAILSATGNPIETRFVPSLSMPLESRQKIETHYFWSGNYPGADSDGYTNFGQTDRSKLDPAIPDKDLFTITLSAKEVQP